MKMRLLIIGATVLATCACTSTQTVERPIAELSGPEMFEQLCASCHGALGKGDGPVAPLIKTGVPDLTRIAARAGGEFPTDDVRRKIDGRWDRPAHGARDMPVWGWQFYDSSDANDADARARVDATIDRLIAYLRSIQNQ